MTQIFAEDGSVVPVTAVKVGNGVVTQIKNEKKEGYNALQLGFSEAGKHINKAMQGHIKGLLSNPELREVRVENVENFEKGQIFGLDSFEVGEKISVSGLTKGQGYAGVVKRHGFHGSSKTHGAKHSLRSPGSIGSTDSARVFPGKRMSGHMGNVRATVINLEIAEIDKENGIIKIKGAVPGARNGLVEIRGEGEMKVISDDSKKEATKEIKSIQTDAVLNKEENVNKE